MKYLLLVITLLYTNFCVLGQSTKRPKNVKPKTTQVSNKTDTLPSLPPLPTDPNLKRSPDSIYVETPLVTMGDLIEFGKYLDSKTEDKDFRKLLAYETVIGWLNLRAQQRIKLFYDEKEKLKLKK